METHLRWIMGVVARGGLGYAAVAMVGGRVVVFGGGAVASEQGGAD